MLLKDNNISSKENKQIATFLEMFSGPYTIVKVIEPNSYIIYDEINKQERVMFHVENLRPFKTPSLQFINSNREHVQVSANRQNL